MWRRVLREDAAPGSAKSSGGWRRYCSDAIGEWYLTQRTPASMMAHTPSDALMARAPVSSSTRAGIDARSVPQHQTLASPHANPQLTSSPALIAAKRLVVPSCGRYTGAGRWLH